MAKLPNQKHKMTAGAANGIGRLEKIGKKPPKTIKGEGEAPKARVDKASRS